MSTEGVEQKKVLKVYVKMHDGSRLMGMFYLSATERLQDVMNDERSFLPLHAYDDKGRKQHTLMLAKRFIEQVEEFETIDKSPSDAHTESTGSAKTGITQSSTSPMGEWTLDDSHFEIKDGPAR